MESVVLNDLIDFKNKFIDIKTMDDVEKKSSSTRLALKTMNISLTSERIKSIQKVITAEGFSRLYPMTSFVDTFIPKVSESLKNMVMVIRNGKLSPVQTRLVVIQTVTYLKNLLNLRVDSLLQHEQYKQE